MGSRGHFVGARSAHHGGTGDDAAHLIFAATVYPGCLDGSEKQERCVVAFRHASRRVDSKWNVA
jgi:hypothetical protein